MTEPHLRAADSDRAAVATALGEHMSAGRLTVAEYEERLTRAYAATTYGELAELTADLPTGRARAAAPARREHRPAARRSGWHGAPAWSCHGAGAWQSWASTAVAVLTIWALTSLASRDLLYFWPVWVIGPWGVALLAQARMGPGTTKGSHSGSPSLRGGQGGS